MATYDERRPQAQNEDMQEQDRVSALVLNINNKFSEAESTREDDENRWLQAFHNYRGKYFKNVAFRDHEKSRVFVKITKTKVLADYGQLIDVLFGANKSKSIKRTNGR